MNHLNERELTGFGRSMETSPPTEVLGWAVDAFAPHLTFATGLGAEGCVLIDMIARHRFRIDLFTLDTGLFFPETYALWRRLEQRYDLTIRAVRPQHTVVEQATVRGPRLWEREPDRCCEARKVEPLKAALLGRGAWITAIRRDQTPERATARVIEWDHRYRLARVNPLASWTTQDVWAYLREHEVPYNPLHGQGYPSIGCFPCTTRVVVGENLRVGRWRGRAKTECGLHGRAVTAVPSEPPTQEKDSEDVCGDGARRSYAPSGRESSNRSDVSAGISHPQLFPVFLKLAGRRVVLVGGERVAASKLQALLDLSAQVTVVSPEISAEIERVGVPVVRRQFEATDLDGVWFVVAAAGRDVNRQVVAAAEERRIFVNAVDDPSNASAYMGGTFRRAGMTVAISTDGCAPALAGLVREGLEAVLPEELDSWMTEARAIRQRWVAQGVPMARRRPLLLEALNRLYEGKAAGQGAAGPISERTP